MLNVVVVELPCSMHHGAILLQLLGRQRGIFGGTVRTNRHDVRRAIREPDARAGKSNLHHVLSEVAGRMHHVLMSGGDAAACSVIISAEVRCGTTTTRRL